jgi:hypothetical protein
MPHVIEALIEVAFHVAARRSEPEELALGILAGLRRLHQQQAEESVIVAATMRGMIGDLLLERRLGQVRGDGTAPPPVALPEERASARVAMAVFEDAANSCLAFLPVLPEGEGLEIASRTLVDHLVEVLGGVPDYGVLAARVSDPGSAAARWLAEPWGREVALN